MLLVLAGCGDDGEATGMDDPSDQIETMSTSGTSVADSSESSDDESTGAGGAGPSYGSDEDLARAAELWASIGGDERAWQTSSAWALFPGTVALQSGMEPHGLRQTIYLDDPESSTLSEGSIIIKENYPPEGQGDDLQGVLLMTKREAGFDAPHMDWFWVLYQPDGTVVDDPAFAPKPLAGAGDIPCTGCHADAIGADFVFTND
ncbi:MAG: hypothetical protein H7138_04465 [Myxococcales bacterium]|nr:hypothetical protein [Myxococcales bacterium]